LKFSKICVIGLGYIGLPTASTFAAQGINVLGVDNNPHVLETLRKGELHIQEPGLLEVVKQAIDSGNLSLTFEPEPADAYIIAVPTPFFGEKCADLTYVISAIESIGPHLKSGNLVVLESTSPPRTTIDTLIPLLEKSGLKAGHDFYLAYSPERVLPGQILRELIENARVIGGIDAASAAAGRDLYATFVKGEIVLTDATTAEMVKLMENTYRDVNIAIANEFSQLADRFGVDVWEAITIANRHPRVNILNPGPGVGGHCISVDPWFLVEAAPDITPLIHAARLVNDAQPKYVVELINRVLGNLKERRITVLGLAYKPDVDDLRESPAIEVAHLLNSAGAVVTAFEPQKPDAKIEGLTLALNLESALINAEIVVVLVPHLQFMNLTPGGLADITPARIVVDTVNLWSNSDWKHTGFNYFRLGVGNQPCVHEAEKV
jgi:UDP-N-acetyl-D-mannosaminuronic acid dehydrogenase